MRKITSLTMLLSFILCMVTSIILYLTPHGRVAYWSDWRLWGLTKTQWSNLHLNLGILLLLAGILHLFYNWNPILAYLKNKSRQLNIFTVNFNIALSLTLVVGFGTYFNIPPMQSVLVLSESIKDAASITYGEPPYGHAELSSLRMFTQKVDIDLSEAMQLLEQKNVQVGNESETIYDIAAKNNLKPKEIYEIIKPATLNKEAGELTAFPDSPPPGFGVKNIALVCAEFGLDPTKIILSLSGKGVKAEPEQSIKQIAALNNREPMAIFELIRNAVKES